MAILSREEIISRTYPIIADQLGVDQSVILPHASFIDDLNADSLELVDLMISLEEEFDFDVTDEQAARVQTVEDAIDLIESIGKFRYRIVEVPLESSWTVESLPREDPLFAAHNPDLLRTYEGAVRPAVEIAANEGWELDCDVDFQNALHEGRIVFSDSRPFVDVLLRRPYKLWLERVSVRFKRERRIE